MSPQQELALFTILIGLFWTWLSKPGEWTTPLLIFCLVLAKDKKLLAVLRRAFDKWTSQIEKWSTRESVIRLLSALDLKFIRFRNNIIEHLKLMSWKVGNLKQLTEQFEIRLKKLESRPVCNISAQVEPTLNQSTSSSMNVGQHTYENMSSSPAQNTRSRSNASPSVDNSRVGYGVYQNPRAVFNVRHGDGPIARQSFYFRCELCLVEAFLPEKNQSAVCAKCKPTASVDKCKFFRIIDKERKIFWLCSCDACVQGSLTFKLCLKYPCPQCTGYRPLVQEKTNETLI